MPTIKQKKAVKVLLSEKVGSIGEAMRQSGYSKSVSETPQKLTESEGWKELMEEHLPDDLLSKVHKQGLEATKKENKKTVKDFQTRHKYLDTAYKLKNKYPAVKTDITTKGEKITGFNFIKPEQNEPDHKTSTKTKSGVGDTPES